MNKLNKELLERALVEGVDESYDGSFLGLANRGNLWAGFHIIDNVGTLSNWQCVCTKEEYLAAKTLKENRKTVSEFDLDCYYEFSDDEDFSDIRVGILDHHYIQPFGGTLGNPDELITFYVIKNGSHQIHFRYIRPLTVKAGEIRKPKPLRGFINFYGTTRYDTKEDADKSAGLNRVACIDLSQFNEGEGL